MKYKKKTNFILCWKFFQYILYHGHSTLFAKIILFKQEIQADKKNSGPAPKYSEPQSQAPANHRQNNHESPRKGQQSPKKEFRVSLQSGII